MIYKITKDNIELVYNYLISERYECEEMADEETNCIAIYHDKTFSFHSHENTAAYGDEAILVHASLHYKVEKELIKLRDEVEDITDEMRMNADEVMNPWYYIDQLRDATNDI